MPLKNTSFCLSIPLVFSNTKKRELKIPLRDIRLWIRKDLKCFRNLLTVKLIKINIHPHSGWFFIFGQSPNITGNAQVRLFIGLPATQLLLVTHKWVIFSQASPRGEAPSQTVVRCRLRMQSLNNLTFYHTTSSAFCYAKPTCLTYRFGRR